MNLSSPSWDYFRSNNDDAESVFENSVAKRLFCAEHSIAPHDLSCPPNLPGIECKPVNTGKGWVAFQAKHSNDGKQNVALFRSIEKAFVRKKNKTWNLDTIYCYSSGAPPTTDTKKKQLEADAAKYGISLVWRFEDQILETLRDSMDPVLIRASREFFEKLPQPALYRPKSSSHAEGAGAFHFSQQTVPLIGRDDALKYIEAFLEDSVTFSWCAVVGKGGSGKSRLLLHIGEGLDNSWQWGWLNHSAIQSFSFEEWIPEKDTLIVFDYVVGNEELVQQFFERLNLSLHSDWTAVHKVRVVLLERAEGQWYTDLKHLPLVGNWASGTEHDGEPFEIPRLNDSELSNLASAIIDSRGYKNIAAVDLVDATKSLGAERAPLMMQLLASLAGVGAKDKTALIREFLTHDRTARWAPANIEAEDTDLLAVVTMTGGIVLSKATYANDDVKQYFAEISRFAEQGKLVGAPCGGDQLNALEPDLFGELFVLDELNDVNPLSSKPSSLLSLASGVDLGRGLVSFIERCVDDFPDHPALMCFTTPWADDPNCLAVWKVAIANCIDRLPLSVSERIDQYASLLRTSTSSDQFADALENGMFLRVLAAAVTKAKVANYVGRVSIIALDELDAFQPQPADFMSSLYPEDYCDDVLADVYRLSDTDRQRLLGPHLVTVIHHKLMHALSDRNRPLESATVLYGQLLAWYLEDPKSNYIQSIRQLQHLAANVVTALIQFHHSRQDAEGAVDFAEVVRENDHILSNTVFNGDPVVVRSHIQDRVEAALSVLVMTTRVRDYAYLLTLLDDLRHRQPALEKDPNRASTYVETAVQAANGFENRENFDAYQVVYERCISHSKIFEGLRIIRAMGMIHVQQC